MYLTLFKKSQRNIQNIDYNNIMEDTNIIIPDAIPNYYKLTVNIENPKPLNELSHDTFAKLININHAIAQAWEILKPFEENYTEQYYSFNIPKRSGGLRPIDAPLPEFMEALSKVKNIFEQQIKCLPHNAAHAYVSGRSPYTALEVHQKNQSKWFLKLDLENFFPSCTSELIYEQLIKLYPFYYLPAQRKETLKNIIKLCCLNDCLPQGTPMSPMLTNLVMVSFDYTITNLLKRGLGNHYVYTRYADDILISSKSSFNWQEISNQIAELLQPFKIKHAKTRYGSSAGRNWNLGLMLNKDNNITLGHAKKKQLNAMLNNFLGNFQNGNHWNIPDTQTLQGELSYLKQIEPTYYTYIKEKYEAKYHIADLKDVFKRILCPQRL